MKKTTRKNRIGILAASAVLAFNVASCDYLDVVPIETADVDDMLKTQVDALEYLYGCYGFVQGNGKGSATGYDGKVNGWWIAPLLYYTSRFASDEFVEVDQGVDVSQLIQWNQVTGTNADEKCIPWNTYCDAIGYCNQFIRDLSAAEIEELNPADKTQYLAEAKYLKAYYHFSMMQQFGPVPVMDEMSDRNTLPGDMPGRSHFDYCTEYVVNLCNEAYNDLPPSYSNAQYYGRATRAMAKMVAAKARWLAASPMYNGEFHDPSWKNKTFETPGYGMELVSQTYDRNKWVLARQACLEAIEEAESAGHELFQLEDSETRRSQDEIPLPQIPGVDTSEPEGVEFAKRVMLMRYATVCGPTEGNTEFIWAMRNIAGNMDMASVPHFVMYDQKNQARGGWGMMNPTLYTMQHFLTADGKLPEEDTKFTPKADWYKSSGIKLTADDGNDTPEIINLFVGREPRFYASVGFDGDEYSPVIANRKNLITRMRDSKENGYNTSAGANNQSQTGFLNKKFVHPNFYYTGVDGGHNQAACIDHVFPIFRLADLYLMLAECDARLGEETTEALEYLNRVRTRAGIPALQESDVNGGDDLLKAVLNERFSELYMEGWRRTDITRNMEGPERMSKQCYQSFDALKVDPSFEEFNTPIIIDQPFQWDDRMYLLPVPNSELYTNPQMVQAPFY